MAQYYKIVEVDKKNQLKALFHGINKSRVFEPGRLYIADKKMVDDGGTRYLSGFHVLETLEECVKYLGRFKHKHNKTIVLCECDGMRKKEHSPHNVFLADKMVVLEIIETFNVVGA